MFGIPMHSSVLDGEIKFLKEPNQYQLECQEDFFSSYSPQFNHEENQLVDNFQDLQNQNDNYFVGEITQQQSSMIQELSQNYESYQVKQQMQLTLYEQNQSSQLKQKKTKENTFNQNTKNCLRDYIKQFILKEGKKQKKSDSKSNSDSAFAYSTYFTQFGIDSQSYKNFCKKFFQDDIKMQTFKQAVKLIQNDKHYKESLCFQTIIANNLLPSIKKTISQKNQQDQVFNKQQDEVLKNQIQWALYIMNNYILAN
ncbi:hypothetical protein ABPG72_021145 [Tetrahymena utriculariae]